MVDYTAETAVVEDSSEKTDEPNTNTGPAARDDDKPFDEYTADDWQTWDDNHPGELWIAYKDSDGTVHRVPVWYYHTLGL